MKETDKNTYKIRLDPDTHRIQAIFVALLVSKRNLELEFIFYISELVVNSSRNLQRFAIFVRNLKRNQSNKRNP